jgi:hypothetical protein
MSERSTSRRASTFGPKSRDSATVSTVSAIGRTRLPLGLEILQIGVERIAHGAAELRLDEVRIGGDARDLLAATHPAAGEVADG